MALSASTVWEVRGSVLNGSPGPGVDTNGGGFVAGSGGTDRSQQNAAQVAVGGGIVTSTITTTVVTFTGSTYTVLAGDVGNIVQFISGTNVTAGFYQIASVGAGLNGTWTLDRTPLTSGTTTNAVANMGGALGGSAVNSGLAKLAGAMIGSNRAYCAGAFSTTATLTFSPGSITPTGSVPLTRLIGYGTTRGDSSHATLTLSTNTGLTGISGTSGGFSVEQIDVDCASLGTSTAINLTGTSSGVMNCKVANFTTRGINLATGSVSHIYECEATGGGSAATAAIQIQNTGETVMRCSVHDNQCPGILGGLGGTVAWNLVVNNTGASTDGIQAGADSQTIQNTVHGSGRDGIRVTGSGNGAPQQIRNNLVTNNGGFGINFTAGGTAIPASPWNDGNAYFNNTSGARGNGDSTVGIFGVSPYTNVLDVTLSASPYVGPTTGTTANCALNNTAGGGAACRAAGSPSTWTGNTGTTSFPDMGAVQTRGSNTSPSAGGSPGIIMAT